ncbi:MAG: hypothetical protein D6B26_03025 [Spirochaetaceae bacterium]|nr:MAG: hypothetical protein D6B26_03025 [Spirochaetaceae bacterium]
MTNISRTGKFQLVLVFFLLSLSSHALFAAEFGRAGVHFQVYGEPHEEGNPLYINVLPLTCEQPLLSHMAIKAGTIMSLRISEADSVGLGNLGLKVGMPFYFTDIRQNRAAGFFLGPLLQLSRNFHTREYVISSAVDLGYSLLFTENLSMTLGGEVGFSTFFLDGQVDFRMHLGPGIYFYFID